MICLVLGIDGAEPKIVEELSLPNIESIGKPRKMLTYWDSLTSWGSFQTGLKPIRSRFKFKPWKFDVEEMRKRARALTGKSLWDKVNCVCGVANLPSTYPPSTINGWMVTGGLLTPPDVIYTYPVELWNELKSLNYKMEITPVGLEKDYLEFDPDQMNRECEKILSSRTRAFTYLLKQRPVDLGILVFTVLDRIQHFFWNEKEIVCRWYEKVDRAVGKVLDVADAKNTIALSDHGFCSRGSDLDEHFLSQRAKRWLRIYNPIELMRFSWWHMNGGVEKENIPPGDHRPTGIYVSKSNREVRWIEDAHYDVIRMIKAKDKEIYDRLKSLGYI